MTKDDTFFLSGLSGRDRYLIDHGLDYLPGNHFNFIHKKDFTALLPVSIVLRNDLTTGL